MCHELGYDDGDNRHSHVTTIILPTSQALDTFMYSIILLFYILRLLVTCDSFEVVKFVSAALRLSASHVSL